MTNNQSIEFKRSNNLTEDFVMIDAIGRSGKGMLAHIISSFERVEKQYNLDTVEWVGILWNNEKITMDAASTLLQVEVDTKLYNLYLGRSVNFRPTDDTGVFKNSNPQKYLKRLFMEGDANAVERIIKEKPIMQACIHDGIRNANLYFSAFKYLKMVYIVRDPIYIIFEWVKSDFGKRIGNDPREFQLTTAWKEEVVPYTAIGWEDEYVNINPVERVVALISKHFEMNMKSYKMLNDKKKEKVKLINFEELVTDPLPICNELAKFMGTNTSSDTEVILKAENCPRILTKDDRNKIIKDIKSEVSDKYKKVIEDLIEAYKLKDWKN